MNKTPRLLCSISLLSALTLTLTGCSAISTTASPDSIQGAAIEGSAHGGTQAIVGGRIYVLAANTATNTSYTLAASTSLITSGDGTNPGSDPVPSGAKYVLTGSYGQFSLTGKYQCTAVDQQVYGAVFGGNPGIAGADNANIGLMSVLGDCPNTSSTSPFLGTVPYLYINEVTTVAAAYAMAGYATDSAHVFTSGSPLSATGLKNAFANFNNLVNVSTGIANTVTPGNANSIVPTALINTLANILASCVNSKGQSNSSSGAAANCTTLFTNAKSAGATGTTPTETATAAINIAHNPAANTANLYALQAGVGSPFSGLSSQPNDLTVALSFTTNFSAPHPNFYEPYAIAIDASGNAWVANYGNSSVTKLTAAGVLAGNYNDSTSFLFYYPDAIAIDASGNAWVANQSGSVTKLTNAGACVSTCTFYSALNAPEAIAIDASGNAWVANADNGYSSVVELTNAGAFVGSYAPTGSNFNDPQGIAIDASGNAWVANFFGNTVTKLTSAGACVGTCNYAPSGSNFNQPNSIAIDASGNAWVLNDIGLGSVTELTTAGALVGNFTATGLVTPMAIAFDGSGNAWIANNTRNAVTELTAAGALVGNFNPYDPNGASFSNPYAIAMDASGDIWVPNYSNGTVTEIIGAATPVVTPIVANLVSTANGGAYGGTQAVNRP